MIETTELKKVKNGYLVTVHYFEGHFENGPDTEEYVFDTIRKALKFLKDKLDPKSAE